MTQEPLPPHLKMPAPPVLETERLILRPPREDDIPVMQRRFPQWDVVRYLHAEVPWPYPDDGATKHFAKIAQDIETGAQSHWTITLRGGDGASIGLISLWADDGVKRDQRGFWLDPDYWGRGLMTEAADRVTDYALIELGWPHLWLSNAEVNLASHRVKEKQGAVIVERTPRAYVYGQGVKVTWLLTREAWIAHRQAQPIPLERRLMPKTPVLETARLRLRPPRKRDLPAMQRGFGQWEVTRYLDGHIPWPYPADGAAQNWPSMRGDLARREKCHWAITLRGGDDELMGLVSLWADDGVSRDQRGFWLDPNYWGQGLMTEAADRVTDFALVKLGWPRLWLCNAEANLASHRLKEKQGAVIVDRTPRRYVYGEGTRVTWLLTREAPQPTQPR